MQIFGIYGKLYFYSLAVPLWLVILLTCVYSLVVIFGVFGNILVIQAVARSVNLIWAFAIRVDSCLCYAVDTPVYCIYV